MAKSKKVIKKVGRKGDFVNIKSSSRYIDIVKTGLGTVASPYIHTVDLSANFTTQITERTAAITALNTSASTAETNIATAKTALATKIKPPNSVALSVTIQSNGDFFDILSISPSENIGYGTDISLSSTNYQGKKWLNMNNEFSLNGLKSKISDYMINSVTMQSKASVTDPDPALVDLKITSKFRDGFKFSLINKIYYGQPSNYKLPDYGKIEIIFYVLG